MSWLYLTTISKILFLTEEQFSKTWFAGSSAAAMSQRPRFVTTFLLFIFQHTDPWCLHTAEGTEGHTGRCSGARLRRSTKASPLLAGMQALSHRHLEGGWEQCFHGQEAVGMCSRAVSCQPQRSPSRAGVPPSGHNQLTFRSIALCSECCHLFEWSILSLLGASTLCIFPLKDSPLTFCLANTYLSLKPQLKGHLQIWCLKKRFGLISLF